MDIDQLIHDCAAAASDTAPTKAVREILARAVSNPTDLIQTLGEPTRAEIQRLHVSDELTVLNVIWAQCMTLMPHNHNMWATIGVYGGDFFRQERSEWDPESLEERPYDIEKNVRYFEEANRTQAQ